MMPLDFGGWSARGPQARDISKDVLNLLSRLKRLHDEQAPLDQGARLSERLPREYRCLVAQIEALEQMRALGADNKLIMETLQVALEALGLAVAGQPAIPANPPSVFANDKRRPMSMTRDGAARSIGISGGRIPARRVVD